MYSKWQIKFCDHTFLRGRGCSLTLINLTYMSFFFYETVIMNVPVTSSELFCSVSYSQKLVPEENIKCISYII